MAVEEDPMALLAYHPERIEALWRHTRHAIDELAAIASDDPAAAEAMRAVRLAQAHLEADWLPLLDRIRSNTALSAPIDLDPGDGRSWFDDSIDALFGPTEGRTVIAPIVDAFTTEERAFFEGFVSECAASVAAELSHYDAHPDYQVDRLPDELRTLDDRREWDWLARLYLLEQYHHMVDTGAVELQRNGEHYWIDPIDLTDTNKVVMGDVILAAVASAGRFSKAGSGGISAAGAHTARAPLPAPRALGVARASSPIWKSLHTYRGGIRTNGLRGRARRFYTWDGAHNEIEVFDKNGRHLGAMDPVSGVMIKPPRRGRTEEGLR
jgi:hypothetical protein